VVWRRSKSVGARGEGAGVQQKIRARMIAALVLSGGAWLPEIHPDATPERALLALPAGDRLLLDPDGPPLGAEPLGASAVVAVGPEGGFEPAEVALLEETGFRRARLPGNILRFETAAIVGIALTRAALDLTATRTPRSEP
jgi:16S rRNA (uracil1498-N3)-methyltransferase